VRPPRHPWHESHLDRRLAIGLGLAVSMLLLVLIVKTLLPWLLLVGLAVTGLWLWHRQQSQERALHLLFYDLIAAKNGQITLLEFAMAARLTGTEAREFLDARAKEFLADFEATPAGDVLYTFRLGSSADIPETRVDDSSSQVDVSTISAGGSELRSWELTLSEIELARRLGCSITELAHKRNESDFHQWSRNRDPDGCSWAYNPRWDIYHPAQLPNYL
jgi:hypothetical protein